MEVTSTTQWIHPFSIKRCEEEILRSSGVVLLVNSAVPGAPSKTRHLPAACTCRARNVGCGKWKLKVRARSQVQGK